MTLWWNVLGCGFVRLNSTFFSCKQNLLHYRHWRGGKYVLRSGISPISKEKKKHLIFLWVSLHLHLIVHTLFLAGAAVRAEHPASSCSASVCLSPFPASRPVSLLLKKRGLRPTLGCWPRGTEGHVALLPGLALSWETGRVHAGGPSPPAWGGAPKTACSADIACQPKKIIHLVVSAFFFFVIAFNKSNASLKWFRQPFASTFLSAVKAGGFRHMPACE